VAIAVAAVESTSIRRPNCSVSLPSMMYAQLRIDGRPTRRGITSSGGVNVTRTVAEATTADEAIALIVYDMQVGIAPVRRALSGYSTDLGQTTSR
jgi:hypothetical protein